MRSKFLASLFFAFFSLQASASAVVTLGSCNFAFGPYAGIATVSGFDQALCSVAPTTTNSIAVANFSGMVIDPSAHGPYDVVIDLHTSSGWVTVFDSPDYAVDTLMSAILPATINFATLTVDQLRLRGTHDVSWNFHTGNGSEKFTLNDASVVPEPASLALFGLAIAGLAVARRRKG